MIVSMEKLFNEKQLTTVEYFPRHHFVLVPLGDGQMNGLSLGDQWNGVLNALKSEIKELRDRLQEQREAHQGSFQEFRDQQERGIASLKKDFCDCQEKSFAAMKMMEERMKSQGFSMEKMEERVVQKMEERVGRMEESLLTLLREINRG